MLLVSRSASSCGRLPVGCLPHALPARLTNAHTALPFENAPDELCCPITLALFVDPVQTVHGQTYERTAIKDWFTTHKTDLMTGETLLTTAVHPA